jgi:hypothetical protein
LPITVRSGSTPVSSCAPPGATRKPLITSSNTSSAPLSVHSSRSSSSCPQAGGTSPMLAGYGSHSAAANSCSANAARSAASSFQGTITVAAAAAAVTPGEAGMPCVASPEPASASSPSTCPW